MEAKLKEYRALRRRKELIENAKQKIEESKEKLVNFLVPKIIRDMGKVHEDEVLLMENEEPPPTDNTVEEINDVVSEVSEVESFEEPEEPWRHCLIRWTVYLCIWAVFWAVFIHLQFGAVYFVISVLIGIYLNTRTRPRKKGEVSAYSVFNQNCVSIDGTLKAEQFEREIRYGAGTVRSF
ncbi:SAYSvFN domain-containing protein 1 [Spodoptera litura]|uniref:SAYSvFN domain-containing protein 1 n=1 Tax=Spodoptera litura TaxID=69820 RepID=A0A9J7DSI4_SPOLT|nr:SAYSvFN domain-containing protein 1 [Spodoptera litura]XP_022817660.1 SAYSvFN domain-containing protein 1 [Spodoptera litura]